jgi:hypothetical protein
MPDFSLGLAIVLLLVLGAEFVNGWTDAPNAIATVVSTRCLSPFQAVCMASMLNLAGVLSGTAVAETIGKDIIDPSAVDLLTVGGAMVGIILWSTLAAGWHSNQRVACFGCRLDWRWVRLGWTAGSGLGRMGKGPARLVALLRSGVPGRWTRYDAGLLALSKDSTCAHSRDVSSPPNLLLGVHGLQPWLERRPEVYGNLHLGFGPQWLVK